MSIPHPPRQVRQENHPPHRWVIADARRLWHLAASAFRQNLGFLIGTPSGSTRWQIAVSADPRKWFLVTRSSPGEFYGRTLHRKTDLQVHACISPDFARRHPSIERRHPDLAAFPFAPHLLYPDEIIIGFIEIDPPRPAQRAFHVLSSRKTAPYHTTRRVSLLLNHGPVWTVCSTDPRRAVRSLKLAVRDRVLSRLVS